MQKKKKKALLTIDSKHGFCFLMDGISNTGSFASVRGIIILRFCVERVNIHGHSAISAVRTEEKIMIEKLT